MNILIAVSKMFGDMQVSIEDIFSENGMVATRIRYRAFHIGECMGIAVTGRNISFEALHLTHYWWKKTPAGLRKQPPITGSGGCSR